VPYNEGNLLLSPVIFVVHHLPLHPLQENSIPVPQHIMVDRGPDGSDPPGFVEVRRGQVHY
jgi:hypothetical protein